MTLQELERLKDILQWAKGQTKTGGMFDAIVAAQDNINREITLKIMDPRLSTDISGNPIDGL